MDEEKPPPRMCPRCYSDNIRFCYYNNYSLSQPRYTCKNCRRLWTHGGTLRNIPIGGSVRTAKLPRIDQPYVAQVVPVETQQVNHHQPFLHDQETNDFLGSIGGSSSSATAIVGNLVGSSDLVSNPLTNQSIGARVNNYNSYSVNQEDPNKPKQNFNNTMSMNHNASTSGSRRG